jgi:hypothetical protein
MERGGTLMHLHIQSVIRIVISCAAEATKLIKRKLGWCDNDAGCPPGALVLSRQLRNKGLHTWHGLLGYVAAHARIRTVICMRVCMELRG